MSIKVSSKAEMIAAIKVKYPNQHVKDGINFSKSTNDSIWLSGEDSSVDVNGKPIFSYYDDGKHYHFGVINHLVEWAESHGWYFEWYDAGTIFMWEI